MRDHIFLYITAKKKKKYFGFCNEKDKNKPLPYPAELFIVSLNVIKTHNLPAFAHRFMPFLSLTMIFCSSSPFTSAHVLERTAPSV